MLCYWMRLSSLGVKRPQERRNCVKVESPGQEDTEVRSCPLGQEWPQRGQVGLIGVQLHEFALRAGVE